MSNNLITINIVPANSENVFVKQSSIKWLEDVPRDIQSEEVYNDALCFSTTPAGKRLFGYFSLAICLGILLTLMLGHSYVDDPFLFIVACIIGLSFFRFVQ